MDDRLKLASAALITTWRQSVQENCSHYTLAVTARKLLETTGNAISGVQSWTFTDGSNGSNKLKIDNISTLQCVVQQSGRHGHTDSCFVNLLCCS